MREAGKERKERERKVEENKGRERKVEESKGKGGRGREGKEKKGKEREREGSQGEVVFVASGTRDTFTLEDSLCAGKMAHDLEKLVGAELSDVAIAMAALYEQNKEDIHVIASKGKHYKRVQEIGDVRDVEYCYQSDVLKVVPIYTTEGTLVNIVE